MSGGLHNFGKATFGLMSVVRMFHKVNKDGIVHSTTREDRIGTPRNLEGDRFTIDIKDDEILREERPSTTCYDLIFYQSSTLLTLSPNTYRSSKYMQGEEHIYYF